MQYILAVYRSRNVSMSVYNLLVKKGGVCALVSTPSAANVGCGLSVKMDKRTYLSFADVISSAETFVGFFLVKLTMGGTVVTKL